MGLERSTSSGIVLTSLAMVTPAGHALGVEDDLDRTLHLWDVADGDTGAAGEAPPVCREEAPVGIVQKDYAHTLAPEPVSTARHMMALTSRSTLGPRSDMLGSGAPRYRP